MKAKIKEVHDYFKSKILSGEFEIKETTAHIMDILIDGEYCFKIWTGNMDIPTSTKLYDGKLSFMNISLNNEEAKKLNRLVLPLVKKGQIKNLLDLKIKEVDYLRDKLTQLEQVTPETTEEKI